MIGTEQYTDKYIMERMEIMSKVAVVYWSGTGNTATGVSFTVIRKYLQQLIINADKQGASKSREYITFISGRFSAFLLRNKTPFLRTDMENPYPVISMLTKPHKSRTE